MCIDSSYSSDSEHKLRYQVLQDTTYENADNNISSNNSYTYTRVCFVYTVQIQY